jgi:hypothetical protein
MQVVTNQSYCPCTHALLDEHLGAKPIVRSHDSATRNISERGGILTDTISNSLFLVYTLERRRTQIEP